MQCPKCGSNNVNVQVVTESKLVNKHHNIFWWLIIGWWWMLIKWLIFTIPAIFFKLFGGKRQKLKQKHKSMFVCQDCGYKWEA